MPVVRRGDDHALDVFPLQEFLVVVVGLDITTHAFLHGILSPSLAPLIHFRKGADLDLLPLLLPLKQLAQMAAAHAAETDDSDTDNLVLCNETACCGGMWIDRIHLGPGFRRAGHNGTNPGKGRALSRVTQEITTVHVRFSMCFHRQFLSLIPCSPDTHFL